MTAGPDGRQRRTRRGGTSPVAADRLPRITAQRRSRRARRALSPRCPACVIRYLVKEGDQVKRGDPVLVLEAMKMENTLPAPADGRVAAAAAQGRRSVARGDVLAVIG